MQHSRDWASLRREFPTLDAKTYLNSCSLGLLSRRTRAAMDRYMDQWTELGAAAWYSDWMNEVAELRQGFASVINADPDEIAIMPNISVALTSIASCLELGEGDNVVTTALDFPTVPHQFHAKSGMGVETRVIQPRDKIEVDLEQFESAIDERTKLVATSHVYFTSGFIQDVAAVTEIAHRHGTLAFIDDYQSTGQVPIDVRAQGIDMLASGGLKWLLGGTGIAYLYVRRDLIDRLEPTVTGWFGNRDQFEFNPNEMVFKEDAGRFEMGTPSVAAIFAGAEGLRIVNEIGPEAIRERTSELTQQLVSGLREEGFDLRCPEEARRHASITMVEMEDPARMVEELSKRDFILDFRPGAVRVSPYFYNTPDDIQAVVAAMTEIRNALEL
ncbi:MAG: aminotransferase class V-fold PLP-dependent enzyme [Chloroflexi bacterium]|nr:aminotransferase class V-fold PLP-dependent enzyme [Chloroflexota bacterium]